MKRVATLILLLMILGCSTIQIPDYIKADRAYIRKISGDFDTIVATVKDVLYKENWLIQAELKPSDYERRPGGEDQTRDILLFTEVKAHKLTYKTYTHMNVFIHATADGAEIDLRYEALTPSAPIKKSNLRNDRLAKRILDAIEQLVLEGK